MKKKYVIIILFSSVLASCNIYTFYPNKESQTFPATSPNEIKIYSGDIDRPYTVIGSVAADALGRSEVVAKYLKSKASKQGADAILFAELTKISTMAQRTGISGVAVKFK